MFTFFLLSSCCDYNELNMQSLVKWAGVDFSQDEVSVSVVCEGEEVMTSTGKSFFEAVREMSGRSDKKLYWGHTQVIVFGEDALENSFDATLDATLRSRDVFLDITPVAAREMTAKEALTAVKFDVFANSGNSRRFEAVELWELLRNREMFGVCVVPTVVKRDGGYVMSGGAVILDSGFVGYLSDEEILFRSLLTDRTAGGYLPTIESGDRSVSFEILSNDLYVKREGDSFLIREKLTLSPAEVRGELSEAEMKSLAHAYLMSSYEKFINTSRKNGFGNILNLHGAEKDADIKVVVDVKINSVLGGA